METLNSLKRLVLEACEALNASIEILSAESLPIDARIKAHAKCLEAHTRISNMIATESRLMRAELTAMTSLMTYQTVEEQPASVWESGALVESLRPCTRRSAEAQELVLATPKRTPAQ